MRIEWVTWAIMTAAGQVGAPERPPTSAEVVAVVQQLDALAVQIHPKAAEVKWQRIPWVTDVVAGLKTAKNEKRPIVLWLAGDPPLERC